MKKWIGYLLALTLLLSIALPATALGVSYYSIGDKMEDFTATLSDGTEVTLYGLLSEKKAVLINFWATWCPPCRAEFPAMQQAYDEMADDIGILALSIEPSDTNKAVESLKSELGLSTLPMGLDSGNIANRFHFSAIPTSIMVDGDGIVRYQESGSLPSKQAFLQLFSQYMGSSSSAASAQSAAVEEPDANELAAALQIQGDAITVKGLPNEAAWPFLPAEDGTYAYASNRETAESYAMLVLGVTAGAGDALVYEYATDFPAAINILSVALGGEIKCVYGGTADWKTAYLPIETDGEHEIVFTFARGSNSNGDTSAMLRGLRVVPAAEPETLLQSLPQAPEKTLSGTDCAVELVQGDVRSCEMQMSGDDTRYPFYILTGDSVTYRIKTGDGVNDDLAFVGVNGEYTMLTSLERDSEGYLYTYTKGAPDALGNYTLYVYHSIIDQEDASPKASVDWFDAPEDVEKNLDELRAMLESYGMTGVDFSWEYVDDEPAAQAQTAELTTAQTAEGTAEYTIYVVDDAGNPLEGAMVQICDEGTCAVASTDAEGKVVHEAAPYPYEIHTLMAPQGYVVDNGIYILPKEGGSVTITLKKE